ncbi:hypothetical protein [Methylomonas sp. 2B]
MSESHRETLAMILFIRNVPASTHLSELEAYVAPALKRRFLFGGARILKAEILVILDKTTHTLEYHGLVHIDSDKVGLRAIKSLKGQRFKNKLVLVREYHNRNWHNDRRQTYQATQALADKRVADRRRGASLEFVKDISAIFSAPKTAARKLI